MKKILFRKLLYDCLIFFFTTLFSLSLIIWVFQAVNFLDLMVEDGRDAEGISRLTGADINAVATVFSSLLTIMDDNAQSAIAKPCVRPLLYNSSQ